MASFTRILNAVGNKTSMVWVCTTYMNTKVFINYIFKTMGKYSIKKLSFLQWVEDGKGGQMVMDRDLTGGGEHIIQCIDDVL